MSEEVKGLTDDDDYVEECEEENPQGKKKKAKKTDFMQLTGNLITDINYKVAFLLFVIGMIVFSDVFIDNVISKIDGTVDGEITTSKGTILQLLFLVIGYVIADLVVKYEVL